MNSLVCIPSGLPTPELEIMLSVAQNKILKKDNVTILSCSGGKGYACAFNIYAIQSICKSCINRRNHGIKLIKGNFKLLTYPQKIIKKYTKINKDKISNYFYKKSDVGQAAYSSYLGKSRDLKIEGRLANYSLKKLINTSYTISIFFENFLNNNFFNEVSIYNGRQNHIRPIYKIARSKNINCSMFEFSGLNYKCCYQFKNVFLQDPYGIKMHTNYLLKNKKISTKKFHSAFHFLKNKGAFDQKKSFITQQVQGKLPENWDFKKKNLVFFTVSEDEYACLGGNFNKNYIFKDQFEAIKRISEKIISLKISSKYHLWIKMHPNLNDVNWNYLKEIYKLESEYNFLSVIKPNSKISSYAMLDSSDKIITFGSSLGMEAVFWNKPSILLSHSTYELLGGTYRPKTFDQLVKLLFTELKPKSFKHSYRFALFQYFGGKSINCFTGDIYNGYKFNNNYIKQSFFCRIIYVCSKVFVEEFFNKLNFYLSQKIK